MNRRLARSAVLIGVLAAVASTPVRAEQDLPLPTPRQGEILRIPGLPPVELPPGAKVFGPRGPEIAPPPAVRSPTKPSARGEQPDVDANKRDEEQAGDASRERAAPPKLSEEAQRGHVLDELFRQLAAAENADDAKSVAAAIQSIWGRSGSDTADLLSSRAMAALAAGQKDLALQLLDHVVEVAPDWAEGWNKRATIRFLVDDYEGSMSDIDRTLVLEPRHFGSLSGLATILQRSGYEKRALEVLRKLIVIYPHQADVQKLIDRLSPDVDGRDI